MSDAAEISYEMADYMMKAKEQWTNYSEQTIS
jgi:hypothetical protein